MFGELVFCSIFQPGYIRWSVTRAGGTDRCWKCPSKLPLAIDTYLSWESNAIHSGEGRAVLKRDTFTNQSRRPLGFNVAINNCFHLNCGGDLVITAIRNCAQFYSAAENNTTLFRL